MTREEAINEIKSWAIPSEKGREVLETLIPELAESDDEESDDERIRKRLIEYFEGFRMGNAEVRWEGLIVQEVLAWLEKQKENPKSTDFIPSDCTADAKCEDRWHKVSDSLPDSTREVLCKDAIGNYFIGRYYSEGVWEVSMYDDCDKSNEDNPPVVMWIDIPSEKQKEQKQAQTSEEKEYIRTIKSIISDFIRDKKPENLAYYQRIYDWLDERHVPFSCGHENGKPAEWSGQIEGGKEMTLAEYLNTK